MTDDSDLIRVIDDSGAAADEPFAAWKVAIIDDDPAVHEGTRSGNGGGRGGGLLSVNAALSTVVPGKRGLILRALSIAPCALD